MTPIQFATLLIRFYCIFALVLATAALATMHRVKGLEFEHVIVAGVNEGIIPLKVHHSTETEAFEAAETETRERALLYVAVTRAKRGALITSHGVKSSFLT